MSMRRRATAALVLAALVARLCEAQPHAASRPDTGSMDGEAQPDGASRLVITPTFGQCFSNGTTTFRANAAVSWQLVAMDGAVPFTVVEQTETVLTVRAGRRGGRMLVVAQATGCEAGSSCAEQLSSPTCSPVASGETTLGQLGAGACSQAFADASWTVVPWWKARRSWRSCCSVPHPPPQVVGITVMLTLLAVLFALVVVARLRLVKMDEGLGRFGVDLEPTPTSAGLSRLQVSVGPSAPIFPAMPKSGF